MNMNVSQADMQGLVNRLVRLARLDTTVFDEVRLDASATVPSVIVAVVATFLAGFGGWLWWVMSSNFDTGSGQVLIKSAILGSIFAIAMWVVWVLLIYVILTQVFRAQADVQQLVRTMGMAAAPLGLTILMFIPGISFGIALASVALFFGLSTMAAQAATNAAPAKVLVASIAGFAVWAIVLTVLTGDVSISRGGDLSINTYAPGIFIFALGS
jgi:hypothetical protein